MGYGSRWRGRGEDLRCFCSQAARAAVCSDFILRLCALRSVRVFWDVSVTWPALACCVLSWRGIQLFWLSALWKHHAKFAS